MSDKPSPSVAGASSTAAAASAGALKGGELHCVRCHKTFDPSNDDANQCIIEHDTETFEGSRDGTAWYTGTLGCCGADYRFHRHYSDEEADPEYCFEGEHTTDPSHVQYNEHTIQPCKESKCGKGLHVATKAEYERQLEAKKRARDAMKLSKKQDKKKKRARIDELKREGKRREARRLRAEVLGMDPDDPELNSDVDPDGCEEFDYASDSSLVPPWHLDDSD